MARRRRKSKVYYNNETDTWSNDSGEQPYLMPGTESYEAYQASLLEKENQKNGDEFHDDLERTNESLRASQLKKSKKIDDAFNVGNRKFRRQRSKARKNKEIEKILSEGLGHKVDIEGGLLGHYGLPCISNSEELYDDSLDAREYENAVIKEYEKEAKAIRDVPNVDVNGDGKVDENDIEMTPGMKTLMKYM